ncbi:MAG: hypothetical protein OXR66_03635 [Candidatus Woesearchaeota archaeon]|nr:hypothetical protein [Candidatus Woesearchaeota archaeon]
MKYFEKLSERFPYAAAGCRSAVESMRNDTIDELNVPFPFYPMAKSIQGAISGTLGYLSARSQGRTHKRIQHLSH